MWQQSMSVPASTMFVAHTFEVVQQAKVATVVRLGDINPVCRRLVNSSPNTKPRTYLHLWGGVGAVPSSSCSAPGVWVWCLPPAGVLPMPGGGALRVGGEGALVVLASLGG